MAGRTDQHSDSWRHGVPRYRPDAVDPTLFLEPPFAFFRDRPTYQGRVRIRRVIPKPDPEPIRVVSRSHSQRRASSKVAVSREGARRFLKSVLSNNTPTEHPPHPTSRRRGSWSPLKRSPSNGSSSDDSENMRSGIRNSISGPMNPSLQRSRLGSTPDGRSAPNGTLSTSAPAGASPLHRPSTSAMPSDIIPTMRLDEEKPVAAGNGISVGIILAEPVLFLQGFDSQTEHAPGSTAMLRGSLHLRVQKTAKIKAVNLKFRGISLTKWPEGIPPRKVDFEERDTLMSHTWPFFNAQFDSAEMGTGADHVQLFHAGELGTPGGRADSLGRLSPSTSAVNLSSKEAKKLSLQANQSRSFEKNNPGGPSVATRGYRMFLPGDYIYNFELPLDSRLPETIDVELGSVKYELEAVVERSGAFRSNLSGSKEVTLIRAPAEGSLEQIEPIAISRNWEDQLHYDIVISGKSFPLGSQVPIAFKLTPLAKVQCHRIKVLVTENIEYFCSNKRVHRMEPTRKVQLFEKRADGPATSTFAGSTMRVTAGGGIPYDARARAARGENVIPNDTTNLLGRLEGESNVGPTEMEFSVQLPSCHTMKDRERSQKLHFDTTYQNIQVHHWIKIVMRLSKPDKDDSTKRRHFEISIDSPFHILSCRATQTNISLPAYTSPNPGQQENSSLYECGCPGAALRRSSPHSFVPTLNALNSQRTGSDVEDRPTTPTLQSPGLTRPPVAHVHGIPNPNNRDRPIHLLRAPSFNPPAFEDEEPPPPLITPPPQYDSIASPTHGLADYFARLGDAYDEDDEGDASHSGGRVNIPLTPGGRINRSMDIGRPWVPVGH